MTLVVETPRLRLRHFVAEDADALYAILSNPKVMRYSLTGAKTREETADFIRTAIEKQRLDGFAVWALVHKESTRLIGYCGLFQRTVDGKAEIELTYRLDPAFWDQRLGREAARAVLDYAKNNLGLPRLVAMIGANNPRSIRLAEAIGMRFERQIAYEGARLGMYVSGRRHGVPPTSAL